MAPQLNNRRVSLQTELETFLGNENVYFQPPETIRMQYPAIVYDLYRLNQRFADNMSYKKAPCYSVTIMDRKSDIDWIEKMLDTFEYCALERTYVADNLNHYSFVLYY